MVAQDVPAQVACPIWRLGSYLCCIADRVAALAEFGDPGDRDLAAVRGPVVGEDQSARRVPSHRTGLLGERYAIDFIGVDHRRRTADRRDWRTFLASEPAERFFAYGRPILTPPSTCIWRFRSRGAAVPADPGAICVGPAGAPPGKEWVRSPATT